MQMEEGLREVWQPRSREEQQQPQSASTTSAATSAWSSLTSGTVKLPPDDGRQSDEAPVRGLVNGREGHQVLKRAAADHLQQRQV